MLQDHDLEAIDTMDVEELRDTLFEMLIRYRTMQIRVEHLEQVIQNIAGGKVTVE